MSAASSSPLPPSASASVSVAAISSAQRKSDGCWGLDLPTDPLARLAKLGERCAEGMTPMFASSAAPNGSSSASIASLPPGACLRAAAVAGESGVELSLVDSEGKIQAIDKDPAFAIVPPRGPICPRGPLVIRARRLAGDGPMWWQAWSTH